MPDMPYTVETTTTDGRVTVQLFCAVCPWSAMLTGDDRNEVAEFLVDRWQEHYRQHNDTHKGVD